MVMEEKDMKKKEILRLTDGREITGGPFVYVDDEAREKMALKSASALIVNMVTPGLKLRKYSIR